MNTIAVWVLVIYMSGGRDGGPTVIDNISTLQECTRVAEVLRPSRYTDRVQCVEVRKVRP